MAPMSREELEEMAAGARDMARIIKAEYDAFIEVGFNDGQAMALTVVFVQIFVSQGIMNDDE